MTTKTNLISIRNSSDIKLNGITAETESENGTIKRVTLTDSDGNKFICTDGYPARFLIPEPPKMKTAYRLTGTFKGLPVDETFDHEDQALGRKHEISGYTECDTMTITKTEVEDKAD